MSSQSINNSFTVFTDIDGNPVENGYIYIGTAGTSPAASPINVYWDAALTVPASQPIRTIGGYPSNSGSVGTLYIDEDDYSLTVANRNNSVVYTAVNATSRISSSLITYKQSETGAVSRTLGARATDMLSVKDFGATGDGSTDDTTAIQAALDGAGKRTVYFPAGTYNVTSTLTIDSATDTGLSLVGEGQSTIISYTGTTSNIPVIKYEGGSNSAFLTIENFKIENTYRTGDTVLNGIVGIQVGKQDDVATTGVGGTCNVTIRKIQSLYFEEHIDIYSESDQVTIEECYAFVWTGTAIKSQIAGAAIVSGAANSAVRIKNCHLSGGQANSLGIRHLGAACSVTGCVIQSAAIINGIRMVNCETFTITDNYFEGATGTTANSFVYVENSISGYIGQLTLAGAASTNLIDIDATSTNINIGPNQITESGGTPNAHVNITSGATGINILGSQNSTGTNNIISGDYDFLFSGDNKLTGGEVRGELMTTEKSFTNINATTTSTIFTCAAGPASYLVSIDQGVEFYTAHCVVSVAEGSSTAQIFNSANSNANLTLSVSGLNIQATNGEAATRTVNHGIIRIL